MCVLRTVRTSSALHTTWADPVGEGVQCLSCVALPSSSSCCSLPCSFPEVFLPRITSWMTAESLPLFSWQSTGSIMFLSSAETGMTASRETTHCKTNHRSHHNQHHEQHHQPYRNDSDTGGVHGDHHGHAKSSSGSSISSSSHPHPQHHHHLRGHGAADFYCNASKPHKRHPDMDNHISPRTSHASLLQTDQQALGFRESDRDAREKAECGGYSYASNNRVFHRRNRSMSNSRRSSITGDDIDSSMATLSLSPTSSSINTSASPLTPALETDALDAMEKEQEGIVMKLMHEIQMLRDENKILKNLLRVSESPSSPCMGYAPSSNPTSSGSSVSSSSSPSTPFISQRRATFTTATNMKRVPANITYSNSNGSITNVSTFPRSRSGSLSMNWKASTLSPKLSGAPNFTLTESFPFDTEYLSLTPRRSSIRNLNGAPSLSIPQKILSYANNEESIEDSADENSDTEVKRLKPFKKFHKRSVSDNTECNISKQNKIGSLEHSQEHNRDNNNNINAAGVSPGLLIKNTSNE